MPNVVNPSGRVVNIPDPTKIQRLLAKEPYTEPMYDDNGKLLVRGVRGWRRCTQADLDRDAKLTAAAQAERATKIFEESKMRANTIIVNQVLDSGASPIEPATRKRASKKTDDSGVSDES